VSGLPLGLSEPVRKSACVHAARAGLLRAAGRPVLWVGRPPRGQVAARPSGTQAAAGRASAPRRGSRLRHRSSLARGDRGASPTVAVPGVFRPRVLRAPPGRAGRRPSVPSRHSHLSTLWPRPRRVVFLDPGPELRSGRSSRRHGRWNFPPHSHVSEVPVPPPSTSRACPAHD